MSVCPCPHPTCTDGQICGHLEQDTAGPLGDRVEPKIERELTPAELAEIHDRGDE